MKFKYKNGKAVAITNASKRGLVNKLVGKGILADIPYEKARAIAEQYVNSQESLAVLIKNNPNPFCDEDFRISFERR